MRLRNKPLIGLTIAASGLVLAGAAQISTQDQRQPAAAGEQNAQSSSPSAEPMGDAERVGVVESDRLFQSYPPAQQFNRMAQSLQQEFAQAQQAGDQQRLQQIQAQYGQMQAKLAEQFREDLEAASRELARDGQIGMVVSEVLYAPKNVKKIDVTDDLIEIISETDGETPQNAPTPMPTPED